MTSNESRVLYEANMKLYHVPYYFTIHFLRYSDPLAAWIPRPSSPHGRWTHATLCQPFILLKCVWLAAGDGELLHLISDVPNCQLILRQQHVPTTPMFIKEDLRDLLIWKWLTSLVVIKIELARWKSAYPVNPVGAHVAGERQRMLIWDRE